MPSDNPTSELLTSDQVDPVLLDLARDRSGFADEYPFRSRWLRADGQVLHYVDEGSGSVLLMIHGNPTWSFAWRRLIRDLSASYRVIAMDHLGCGFSSAPQDPDLYTLAGHISRLLSLIRLLDLREITLFAHDWGGAIGMGAAGRAPERFGRFVLMNTAAFRSRAIPARIAVCRTPLIGRWAVQGLNLFVRAALRMATEKPLDAAARSGLLAPYRTWQRRLAVHEFVRDIPLHPAHRSYAVLLAVEQSLAQFRHAPLLLIWGMRDWCFTPSFYDEFRRRFPDAECQPISDAGHYVFEDAHEQIIPRIRQFLAER